MSLEGQMRFSKRARRRNYAGAIGILGLIGGCTEPGSSPTSSESAIAATTRGEMVSSIWSARGGRPSYLGAFSTDITLGKGKTGHFGSVGSQRSVFLDQEQIDNRRPQLFPGYSSSASAERARPGIAVDATADGHVVTRLSLRNSKSFHYKTPEGKNLRVQVKEIPVAGGRQSVLAVFVEDRLIQSTRLSYVREGSGWRPSHARVSTFDSVGTVSAVTDHDISWTSPLGAMRQMGSFGALKEMACQLGRQFGASVLPRPLLAASNLSGAAGDEFEDVPCIGETFAVASTAILAAAYTVELIAAVAACSQGVAPACAAVPGLTAQVAAAGAASVAAIAALADCLCQHGVGCGGGSGGGGGGGGGGTPPSGCAWYEVEISYNGGPWEHWGWILIC